MEAKLIFLAYILFLVCVALRVYASAKQLSFKHGVLWMLGYRYVVNLKSKEIHRLDTKYSQCHLFQIKHKKYIREKQLPVWIASGYNGCRFCLKEFDTDTIEGNDLKISFV